MLQRVPCCSAIGVLVDHHLFSLLLGTIGAACAGASTISRCDAPGWSARRRLRLAIMLMLGSQPIVDWAIPFSRAARMGAIALLVPVGVVLRCPCRLACAFSLRARRWSLGLGHERALSVTRGDAGDLHRHELKFPMTC